MRHRSAVFRVDLPGRAVPCASCCPSPPTTHGAPARTSSSSSVWDSAARSQLLCFAGGRPHRRSHSDSVLTRSRRTPRKEHWTVAAAPAPATTAIYSACFSDNKRMYIIVVSCLDSCYLLPHSNAIIYDVHVIRPLSRPAVNFTAGLAFSRLRSRLSRRRQLSIFAMFLQFRAVFTLLLRFFAFLTFSFYERFLY